MSLRYHRTMNKKLFFIAVLPFLLIGCSNEPSKETSSSEQSSSIEETTIVLQAAFEYYDWVDESAEKRAELLFGGSHYSFPGEVKFDKPLVAGDQLKLVVENYTGTTCTAVYPEQCHISGTLKSYSLVETQISEMHVDDGTIGDIADTIRYSCMLANEYVILDRTGLYTYLDSYDGQDLYLSLDQGRMDSECYCPDGTICGPCPFYVAAMYAYDPRPVNN